MTALAVVLPTNQLATDRREELARKVAEGFQALSVKLADFEKDIRALWTEFDQLRSGETIAGCRTRKEFCEQVLHRNPRTVQYMLAGGNPVSKRGSETVSRPNEPSLPTENPAVPPELQESDDFAAALQKLEDTFPGAIRLIQRKGAVTVKGGRVDLKRFSLDPESPEPSPCPRGKKGFQSINEMREWGQKTGKAIEGGSFSANKCRTCGQFHFDDRQDHVRAMGAERTAENPSATTVAPAYEIYETRPYRGKKWRVRLPKGYKSAICGQRFDSKEAAEQTIERVENELAKVSDGPKTPCSLLTPCPSDSTLSGK